MRRPAQGLARAGFLVGVPDLPGLRLGEITPATTHALVRVALAVAGRGRVSFYGVSVGATLALATESPGLAGRVRAVGGEAPWTDLEKVIRLATQCATTPIPLCGSQSHAPSPPTCRADAIGPGSWRYWTPSPTTIPGPSCRCGEFRAHTRSSRCFSTAIQAASPCSTRGFTGACGSESRRSRLCDA